jgi:myo-inositol 2-dehydrogenase / D-chiro-inositol 1-dehydrogenase
MKMDKQALATDGRMKSALTRRQFVAAGAALAGTVAVAAEPAAQSQPVKIGRKIRIGLIGCGGRGSWIAGLFRKHGGYEFHAVADYFQNVADAGGDKLEVDKSRRFSGLSGYRRLIDSGVEAVALETPPYFFPEHAKAAVEAGLHVYMAKPVAVDVPGTMEILAAGKQATRNRKCFFVDYQMPTDPINIEIVKRIRAGDLGPLAHMTTFGYGGGFADPPLTANIESRLQRLIWVNDIAIGGDWIVNYDIHALDVAMWVVGERPLSAIGQARVCRKDPHGDGRDVFQVLYEFPNGLVLSHHGQGLPNSVDEGLACKVYGQTGTAVINYWGKSSINGTKPYAGGTMENLYQTGAEHNIARFHREVIEGRCENDTLQRAIDGLLMCILGREAAARRTRLTMDALVAENRRLSVDLTGLRA